MKTIKIDKNELLVILRKNELQHISDYKESVEDYINVVLLISQQNLTIAQIGDISKFGNIKYVPSKPISYESYYKKAICMLELSVETIIELSDQDFSQLVLDEWSWKNSFENSNSIYKSLI